MRPAQENWPSAGQPGLSHTPADVASPQACDGDSGRVMIQEYREAPHVRGYCCCADASDFFRRCHSPYGVVSDFRCRACPKAASGPCRHHCDLPCLPPPPPQPMCVPIPCSVAGGLEPLPAAARLSLASWPAACDKGGFYVSGQGREWPAQTIISLQICRADPGICCTTRAVTAASIEDSSVIAEVLRLLRIFGCAVAVLDRQLADVLRKTQAAAWRYRAGAGAAADAYRSLKTCM